MMSEALATSAGRLTLTSPDPLIASIPHLIGFPPQNSVVLVGIAPDDSSHRAPTRLTQGFDRPGGDLPAAGVAQMARQAAGQMITAGCTEVIQRAAPTKGTGMDLRIMDASEIS